jgi:hypothetical protein
MGWTEAADIVAVEATASWPPPGHGCRSGGLPPDGREKMALLKNVEKRIWDIEGFAVIIRHADGRDMRSDRTGIPMYDFARMARNSITVSTWKEQRFLPKYPGFDVDVLDGFGNAVPGNTLLATVRDSYTDD